MTSFKKPKVYFGAGGFTGVGTIGKSPIVGAKKPMVYGGGVSAAKVLTGGGISRGGVMGLSSFPSIVAKPKPEKRLEKFSKAMAEKEKEFIEADAKAEKPGEAEVRKNMMEMAREPKAVEPPKVVTAAVSEFSSYKKPAEVEPIPEVEQVGTTSDALTYEGEAAKADGETLEVPETMAVLPELESVVPLKPIEEVMAEKAAAVEEAPVPQVEVTIAELPKYTGFSKGEWGTGSVTTPELPLGGNGGKKKRRRRRRH